MMAVRQDVVRYGLLRRRSDLSPAEFSRHWADVHGPLVCQLDGFRDYTSAYVQQHLCPSVDGPLGSFDGVSLTVQRPREDYEIGFFQTSDFATALADEHEFLYREACVFLLARMPAVPRGPSEGHKLLAVVTATVGPWADLTGARRSVVAEPLHRTAGVGGLVESWFEDETARDDAVRRVRSLPGVRACAAIREVVQI